MCYVYTLKLYEANIIIPKAPLLRLILIIQKINKNQSLFKAGFEVVLFLTNITC
jgi:hypothetical protein